MRSSSLCARIAALLLLLPAIVLAQENGARPRAITKREAAVTGAPPSPQDYPEWLEKLRKPTDWLTWGADLRLRHEYLLNPNLKDADPPGHQQSYHRYRTRLWSTIAPVQAVSLNVRLTWEGRYYFEPESKEGMPCNEVIWDNLNLRFKLGDPKGTNAVITVGRQDMMLGDGWLVMETTPLDGSRSFYFDAARITLNSGPWSANIVYLENRADSDAWLRPINSDNRILNEQNERGLILWLTHKPAPKTQLDGYFIWKDADKVLANGDDGDVYTFGARASHQFDEHWCARAEAAYQFGARRNSALFPDSDGELRAFGFLGRVSYAFNDHWKNQVYLETEFLSGDDPNTSRNEQFDMLWGRWPQYSELYIYNVQVDQRLGETSNMARINLGWKIAPTSKLTICAAYHAMFAPENPRSGQAGFSNDGYFRGHLLTAAIKYEFNRHMTARLIGEYLLPGNFYAQAPGPLSTREDPAAFLRAELIFAF